MDKQKILFLMRNMKAGSEIVLVNLLNRMDTEKYEVYLLTQKEGNTLLPRIKPEIIILYSDDLNSKLLLWDDVRACKLRSVVAGLYNRILIRLTKDSFRREVYAARSHLLLDEEFDAAIAFKPMEIPYALYQFSAKKHIVWFHSEMIESNPYLITPFFLEELARFDRIFCVSPEIKKQLDRLSDKIRERTEIFYNLQNVEEIRRKAILPAPEIKSGQTVLLTVGRVSPEKGIDRIPEVARKLKDEGYHFHWYVVGDGPQSDIQKLLERYHVSAYVTLLGYRENPYSYMQRCDIYVQPSRFEGYCGTTAEAKILCKPIITTDVSGSRAQFESGINGLIVKSDIESLYQGVKELLDHPALREKFMDALSREICDNYEEMKKLYSTLT